MFIIVFEYSLTTPGVLYADNREAAERNWIIAENSGAVRVTMFESRNGGPCCNEIKTTGIRP